MSFDKFARSVDRASPISLYSFRYGVGDNDFYRYTDADEDVSFDGRMFRRAPIERGEISAEGDLDKSELNVSVPWSLPVARLFRWYPASYVVQLVLFEGHFNDPDREFQQTGIFRVMSGRTEGATTTLTCQPHSTRIRLPGLRRNFQRQCPHVLYGEVCRATPVYTTVSVLESHDNVVTATNPGGGLPSGPEAYAAGSLTWIDSDTGLTEIRTILSCVLNDAVLTFTLAGPVRGTFTEITATKGCNHTEAACTDWHDNINNFGGHVFVPLVNPVNNFGTYY